MTLSTKPFFKGFLVDFFGFWWENGEEIKKIKTQTLDYISYGEAKIVDTILASPLYAVNNEKIISIDNKNFDIEINDLLEIITRLYKEVLSKKRKKSRKICQIKTIQN
jgi:hypothetical protein